MSSAQLCVQAHSKVNSSCAFLPSGSLCQLRLCWGTQLLHLCGHTNAVCSLSTLSHIKNPITLRFWLHWSRWRSRQILTSRPKIYCYRASRTIWIILQGSSTWLCWKVCRNTVLDLAFISLSITLGTLLVMLLYDAEDKTKRESHAWDDSSQTCPESGSFSASTWVHWTSQILCYLVVGLQPMLRSVWLTYFSSSKEQWWHLWRGYFTRRENTFKK